MMRNFLLFLLSLLAFIGSALAGPVDAVPTTATLRFYFIAADTATTAPLAELKLEPKPFLTEGDLVAFNWTSQTMQLTPDAFTHFPNPRPISLQHGKPFIVDAGGERCYQGALWTPISSASYTHPVIFVGPFGTTKNEKQILPGFRISKTTKSANPDPRFDPRIERVLQALGKLTHTRQTHLPNT